MAELITFLSFLASTLGAGLAASAVLNLARDRFPVPSRVEWMAAPAWRRAGLAALHAPRYARFTAMALAAAISVAAAGGLALAGLDARPMLDATLAALIGQVRHGLGLESGVETKIARAEADALMARIGRFNRYWPATPPPPSEADHG